MKVGLLRTTGVLLTAAGILLAAGCPKKSVYNHGHTPVPEAVRKNTGLPMPLKLPEDSVTPQDLDLIPPIRTSETMTWSVPFSYAGGFDKLVESFDAQLKKQKFSRLSGPTNDQDPRFKHSDSIKPLGAQGKKAWVSDDRLIVVFISYTFKRADEKTQQPELNNFQMNVVKFTTPQVVKEPNKVEPIL